MHGRTEYDFVTSVVEDIKKKLDVTFPSSDFKDLITTKKYLYNPECHKYLLDSFRYLYLVENYYHLRPIRSKFTPCNLVELSMPFSWVRQLWNGVPVCFIKLLFYQK